MILLISSCSDLLLGLQKCSLTRLSPNHDPKCIQCANLQFWGALLAALSAALKHLAKKTTNYQTVRCQQTSKHSCRKPISKSLRKLVDFSHVFHVLFMSSLSASSKTTISSNSIWTSEEIRLQHNSMTVQSRFQTDCVFMRWSKSLPGVATTRSGWCLSEAACAAFPTALLKDVAHGPILSPCHMPGREQCSLLRP